MDLMVLEDMMSNIQAESNSYAEQYIQKKAAYLDQHQHTKANAFKGKPVTIPELKAFFEMLIMMGVISFTSIHLYIPWAKSKKWPHFWH